MVRSCIGSCTGFLIALVVVWAPQMVLAADGDVSGSAVSDPGATIIGPSYAPRALRSGGEVPLAAGASCGGDLDAPLLYQNTDICTVNFQWLAVGGRSNAGGTVLQVQDYFTTSGGTLAAYQFLVMNGGEGAIATNMEMRFYADTDALNYGSEVPDTFFRTQSQSGAPSLERIPVHEDENGVALPMLVTIDYVNRRYRVEDWGTGEDLIGTNCEGQDIGDRPRPVLPSGKVGLRIRFSSQFNLCGGGNPTAGAVLAGGGVNSEDGVHIINAENSNCDQEHDQICPTQTGWAPSDVEGERVACTGGDVCSLDRPFNGIWLRLFASPSEAGNGNNTIATADLVSLGSVVDCSSEMVVVEGFLGDASLPNQVTDYFDDQPDGAIDLLDWGVLQSCLGANLFSNPECVVFDQDGSGMVDLNDHAKFVECQADPSAVGCRFNSLQDLDVYRISDLVAGNVLQVLVEGDKSPAFGPTWDPYLRIFTSSGVMVGDSDDFSRIDFDAYTTVEIESGGSLYVAVSSSNQVRSLFGCLDDSDCTAVFGSGSTCGLFVPGDEGEPGELTMTGICQLPPCNADTICEGFGFLIDNATCGVDERCEMPQCSENSECQILFNDDDAVCGDSGDCELPCANETVCILAGFGGSATCGEVTAGICDPPTCVADSICEATPLGEGATCGGLVADVCDPKRCTDDSDCRGFFGDECATCDTMTGFCNAGISYDPTDAGSVCPLTASDLTGGYRLKVVQTDPNCVNDEAGNPDDMCFLLFSPGTPRSHVGDHEPDDTLDDADAQPEIIPSQGGFLTRGILGDGSFASLGQDVDIYRIDLTNGVDVNAQSIQLGVTTTSPSGFDTVFDLVLALYDLNGKLIATGDQSPNIGLVAPSDTENESYPKLQAAITGGSSYYVAIFGTDRDLWDSGCNFKEPAGPPSFLNVPHCRCSPCTADCPDDLRPFVGGRVNKPGEALGGCVTSEGEEPERLQCYTLSVLVHSDPPPHQTPTDPDELANLLGGNDSIDLASPLGSGSSLATAGSSVNHTLGNGPFGGFQGDVDFFQLAVNPGDLLVVNVADTEQPSSTGNNVRSFLALYDGAGDIITLQDYSLEIFSTFGNGIQDEIASTIVTTVPDGMTNMFLMVGIDNGNLLFEENIPLFPFRPGTTFSRRFQTGALPLRFYEIAVAQLSPPNVSGTARMFVVPQRGTDEDHVEPYLGRVSGGNSVIDGLSRESFPPILELDPQTGDVLNVLDAEPTIVMWRDASVSIDGQLFQNQVVSAEPVIAYDGTTLYISVETCSGTCLSPGEFQHPFFWMNPDVPNDDAGFVTPKAQIEGLQSQARITGMTVIQEGGDSWIYALDGANDVMRFWRSDQTPLAGTGGTLVLDTEGGVFDDVYGDIATDGVSIFISCSLDGDALGICKFTPNRDALTLDYVETIPDPVTNHDIFPGPMLGGFDFLTPTQIAGSDQNGPVIQYSTLGITEAQGVELPREFTVVRIATSPVE